MRLPRIHSVPSLSNWVLRLISSVVPSVYYQHRHLRQHTASDGIGLKRPANVISQRAVSRSHWTDAESLCPNPIVHPALGSFSSLFSLPSSFSFLFPFRSSFSSFPSLLSLLFSSLPFLLFFHFPLPPPSSFFPYFFFFLR